MGTLVRLTTTKGETLAMPAQAMSTAATGETVRPMLDIIRRLDPHDLRAAQLKGNPPGIRPAA